jgi:4-oxalocrotonate tautomerase
VFRNQNASVHTYLAQTPKGESQCHLQILSSHEVSSTRSKKEEIIHKTTDMFAGYFGERVRPSSTVLIDEVVDGGWGRADETLTLGKLGLKK